MKPAKNSIIGYSYQKLMGFLLLAKMDVERTINKIEIEADVNHQFDDLVISHNNSEIYCQMKDYQDIKLSEIKFVEKNLIIKGNKHRLSDGVNILFIKNINMNCNSEILGFSSYKTNDTHIISMSREEAKSQISQLYEIDYTRMSVMENYFEKRFDERNLSLHLEDLPPIKVFSNDLVDHTVNIQSWELKVNSLLMIEGKPGVGKSHLVNQLESQDHKVLYRFWISNQDINYKERLEYNNFIANLIKDIFKNYEKKNEAEIIDELIERSLTLVIDGLDHVENYNPKELDLFIAFINKVAERSKVVVLSRPLKIQVDWKKIKLHNWNFEQTYKYLNVQFHISDYSTIKEIYRITQGYPIIVSFIGKYYLTHKQLPLIEQLDNLNEYYKSISDSLSMRSALAVFLSSSSYFMYSEFDDLLDDFAAEMLKDFISTHPYLFEVKLNRISLIHDSLNNFLKSEVNNYESYSYKIVEKVTQSILSGEKRYISRFYYFDLNEDQQKQIIKHYADIGFFSEWIKGTIDIEGVQAFYYQMRKSLKYIDPSFLNIYQYYDFALIQNILSRDHLSNLYGFIYIYVCALIENGYSEEDITSSEYVFSMLYFLGEGDYKALEAITSDHLYGTQNFYENLIEEINDEVEYFRALETPLDIEAKGKLINEENTELAIKETIQDISVSIYTHGTDIEEFEKWSIVVRNLVDKQDEEAAILYFEDILTNVNVRKFWAPSIVKYIVYKLKALGVLRCNNEFLDLSLDKFIEYNHTSGSYQLQTLISDYLRLSIENNRKVDLGAIYKFLVCYYEHKDYSVINIDNALITFQKLNYITIDESIETIRCFQEKSDKGIRNLMNNYLNRLSLEDFEYFINEFNISEFKINLFNLPVSFVNVVPEPLIIKEFQELLSRYSYLRKLDFHDNSSLFFSIYSNKVLDVLKYHGFTIAIDESMLEGLDKKFRNTYGDLLELTTTSQLGKYENNSRKNLENGIITDKDIEYVKGLNLLPFEVATYTDGNHSSLSNLQLYDNYSSENLTKHTKTILHTAITNELKTIKFFSDLFFLVGNVPDFLINYTDEVIEENILFESFINYIKLSLIDYEGL
ncbi:hypothetical protein K6L05_10180 [Salinicoccus roseus]|uniref:hypothetical protein n=1 Tax=Salinicoccus roseus TaxID=45670 RepID=UPI001CA78C3E|nr:hypothetical protein [Salinicoccus roseus]MBY8910161.1 hypothetical protein [Salinicoccus roseus]